MAFTPLPAPTAWYPTSIFNKPIPAGQPLHPNSKNIVAYLLSKGSVPKISEKAGAGGTQYDFSHPVYVAKSTDPKLVLHATDWAEGDPTIYVPAKARPAGYKNTASGGAATYDKSMSIIQPDGTEYSMWNVSSVSPKVVCGFWRRGPVGDNGLGSATDNKRGGITAARYNLGVGQMRVDEMVAGKISHATYCAVNGFRGQIYPSYGSGHTGETSNANAPAMGQWLQLDPAYMTDAKLATMPKWKQIVLRAWRDFGLFCGDFGGSAATFVAHFESETPYIAYGQSPTCLQYLDTTFGHSGTWDIGSGVDWSKLRVLQAPKP